HVREVAFLDPGHCGYLPVRARQVLEHLPADSAQRDTRPFWTLLGARYRDMVGRVRSGTHIFLGDPPLRPGPGHRGEVDSELLSDFADERRCAHLRLAGPLRR